MRNDSLSFKSDKPSQADRLCACSYLTKPQIYKSTILPCSSSNSLRYFGNRKKITLQPLLRKKRSRGHFGVALLSLLTLPNLLTSSTDLETGSLLRMLCRWWFVVVNIDNFLFLVGTGQWYQIYTRHDVRLFLYD